MKRIRTPLLAIFAICVCSQLARAQKLPEGKYHTIRERDFDLKHVRADLSFDFPAGRVRGTAALTLSPLRPLDTVVLDAIALQVHHVREKTTGEALRFESKPKQLEIQLPRTLNSGNTIEIEIAYEARPNGGMYFVENRDVPGHYYVTTYGEDGLHANWIPIYNDVNDKLTSEMVVTVPDSYSVISNGQLVENDSSAAGQKTFHWRQELPHANYLIALYVGDFEKGDLPSALGKIPLSYWVPRGRGSEGARVFRNTPRMVEFFSRRFRYPYPWSKYDQIAVPGYAIGAMEHTGVTGHGASILRNADTPHSFSPSLDKYHDLWTVESIIAHELAHHWFGDNLTCSNLSYIWLNESFATYCQMLWAEESLGHEQLLFDVEWARRSYFAYVKSDHIIRPLEYHYFDDATTIFNVNHTYEKGAAVLHMLRKVVGDDAFFAAIHRYLMEHQFGNVQSHDLQRAFEDHTGRNFEWFFNDWVTGAGHPKLKIGYKYLAARKLLDLSVEQRQPHVKSQDDFKLPVRITIVTPNEKRTETVWLRDGSESFLLRCAEKPLMVSFDGEGDLVAEIVFDKDVAELAYQARNDALIGRLRALRQMATRFPTHEQTQETFRHILKHQDYWANRAEAASLLGHIRTSAAEAMVEQALQDDDYRVRKAAVLALPAFERQFAAAHLRKIVDSHPNDDVVATAIIALAKTEPSLEPPFIKRQLERESWHDEIRIGVLRACGELKRTELLESVRPFAGESCNKDVRLAALQAWKAIAAGDVELHKTLVSFIRTPIYPLQLSVIEMLGDLHVADAKPTLEEIVAEESDANLVVAARKAIREIDRLAELP